MNSGPKNELKSDEPVTSHQPMSRRDAIKAVVWLEPQPYRQLQYRRAGG